MRVLREKFIATLKKHTPAHLHGSIPESRTFLERWEEVQDILACAHQVDKLMNLMERKNPKKKKKKAKK